MIFYQNMKTGVAMVSTCVLLASAVSAANYTEAPSLASAVAAGSLPSVTARLPDAPEVITPVEAVGSYGGVVRRGLRGSPRASASPAGWCMRARTRSPPGYGRA